MSPTTMPVDRRKQRSDQCRKAIHLQLSHLADNYDLHDLVLADSSGLMIACSNDEIDGEALAAYAPLFARRLDRGERGQIMEKLGDLLPGVTGQTLSVRRFTLRDEDHFLCVVGPQRLCRQANLYRAVTGIRRIVRETAA
jgi:hypothetical protein